MRLVALMLLAAVSCASPQKPHSDVELCILRPGEKSLFCPSERIPLGGPWDVDWVCHRLDDHERWAIP